MGLGTEHPPPETMGSQVMGTEKPEAAAAAAPLLAVPCNIRQRMSPPFPTPDASGSLAWTGIRSGCGDNAQAGAAWPMCRVAVVVIIIGTSEDDDDVFEAGPAGDGQGATWWRPNDLESGSPTKRCPPGS